MSYTFFLFFYKSDVVLTTALLFPSILAGGNETLTENVANGCCDMHSGSLVTGVALSGIYISLCIFIFIGADSMSIITSLHHVMTIQKCLPH